MFKITLTLIALAAAVSAQNVEWNECQQRCLEEGGSTGCTTAWNETECFCSTEQFATDVRHCFYENSCWTDIQPFYEEERCGDLARDVSFEDRPGMGGGKSASESASVSATSNAAASSSASASASASASENEAASDSASSGASNTENAGMALVPTWGSGGFVSGAVAIAGAVAGGAMLF